MRDSGHPDVRSSATSVLESTETALKICFGMESAISGANFSTKPRAIFSMISGVWEGSRLAVARITAR